MSLRPVFTGYILNISHPPFEQCSLGALWIATGRKFLDADSQYKFWKGTHCWNESWLGANIILYVLLCYHFEHFIRTATQLTHMQMGQRFLIATLYHPLRPGSSEEYMSQAMRKPVMPYANNKGADQPAHPRRLISAFVVRCLDRIVWYLHLL